MFSQEESWLSPCGIWTCSFRGAAGCLDAMRLGWPGVRGSNRLCSVPHQKCTSKNRILNSFHRGWRWTPLLLVKCSHNFLPMPSLLPYLQLCPWHSWGRNRNPKKSMMMGITQEWKKLGHSSGSQVLIFCVKQSLEVDLKKPCFEISAACIHCSGHAAVRYHRVLVPTATCHRFLD